MKKSIIRHFALAACLCLFATSCDNKFGDDLRSLGHRVEILEERVLEMNTSIEALQAIITTIQTNGYITDIQHNSDGSITLTFNNGNIVTLHDGRIGQDGNDGRDGQDGQDGQEAELIVGVWQDIDGMWYWTVNGTWLLDADGNKVRAGAVDGKDRMVPMVRTVSLDVPTSSPPSPCRPTENTSLSSWLTAVIRSTFLLCNEQEPEGTS